MRHAGLPYQPPTRYVKVDPKRGERIAAAFEAMPHEPDHPLVSASYAALARETKAQYEHAYKHGFRADFIDPEKGDPYAASPRMATEDIRKNNHLSVFPTMAGYGPGGIPEHELRENPMLADTGERWGGKPVLLNDLFRAVHDYYGHAKDSVGFRADGEENAWRSHASMYTPLARIAATTETRGQNSWLNYGPHAEHNRTAPTEDTVFAEQKLGALPLWALHEGAEDFMRPEDIAETKRIYKLHGRDRVRRAEGGGAWTEEDGRQRPFLPPEHFQRSENLDRHLAGSVAPRVLYHGTGVWSDGLGDIRNFDREAASTARSRPTSMDQVGHWFSETPDGSRGDKPGAGMYAPTENGAIYPAHVRIKNPWRPRDFNHFLDQMHVAAGRDPKAQNPRGRGSVDELRAWLQGQGHDGIYFDQGLDHKNQSPTWVALHPHQIKSAVGNRGTFDPSDHDITKADGGDVEGEGGRQLSPQGLYSAGAEAARALPQAKGTGQQMLASLKGVKPEEMKWSGVGGFSDHKSLTRDDLAAHFDAATPNIQTTTHRPAGDPEAKYEKYSIPGGKNYRETLLHLPRSKTADQIAMERGYGGWHSGLTPEQQQEVMASVGQPAYRSNHWDTPNVLAHLRMSDRANQNGEKLLHLEELQSDWGQDARKSGFRDPKNPWALYDGYMSSHVLSRHPSEDAANAEYKRLAAETPGRELSYGQDEAPPAGPYVGSTQNWTDLGLKHLLTEAAHGGHDKVVWTPGEDQADRYKLSNHIGSLEAHPRPGGRVNLIARAPKEDQFFDDEEPKTVLEEEMHPDQLPSYIGKELAQKLMGKVQFPGDDTTMYAVTHMSSGNRGALYHDREEAESHLPTYRKGHPTPDVLQVMPHAVKNRGRPGYLDTPDLKIGGEGMKGYYDNILPKRLLALAREHDPEASLGQDYLSPDGMGDKASRHATKPYPALTITPRMRESIKRNGFKAYADGGEVQARRAVRSQPEGVALTGKIYSRGGGVSPSSIDQALSVVRHR